MTSPNGSNGLQRYRAWYLLARDVGLTLLAVGIIVFELGFQPAPRAVALGVAASLLGLVPVLRKDEAR